MTAKRNFPVQKTETPVLDAPAQDAPVLTETTEQLENVQAQTHYPDPTDLNFFVNNMQLSTQNALGRSKLHWKNTDDRKKWVEHWLRQEDIERYAQQLAERHIVEVRKNGAILGVPFSTLFHDSTFDDGDRVKSKYRQLDKESGSYQSEMRPLIQPIGAARVMNDRRKELVEARTEKKSKERAAEEKEKLSKLARDFSKNGTSMKPGAARIDFKGFGEHEEGGYGAL